MVIPTQLYRLTSPTGRQYIGVTRKPLELRVVQHIYHHSVVGEALRKYGVKNFKIEVLVIGDEDYIYKLEEKAIERFDTMIPQGYNLKGGGQRGCRYTKESRQKMSEAAKRSCLETDRYVPSTAGYTYSEESCQRMSEAQRLSYAAGRIPGFSGKRHSEETKRKMSESAKRRWVEKKRNEIRSCL